MCHVCLTPKPAKEQAPIWPVVVTLPCPTCTKPIELEYDPGYPNSYEEPGVPADWIPTDPEIHDACMNDEQWRQLILQAYDTPEYRAYEYAESQV